MIYRAVLVSVPSGVPEGTDTRTKIEIIRTISIRDCLIPDLTHATLGKRLRYLRKRLGYERITAYATVVGLAHTTIGRVERDEWEVINPYILGRILSPFSDRFKEAFPDVKGDVYDYLIPPKTFGDWLRNFRLRRGLRIKELAGTLGVNKFTITRYEAGHSFPTPEIRSRLQEQYNVNCDFETFLEGKRLN